MTEDVARLRLTVESRGVAKSRTELQKLSRQGKRTQESLGGVKRSAGAVAASMVGMGAVLLTVGATLTKITRNWFSFNKAMLEVQTIAGVTADEMKGLRMQALKLSQTLGVDATDAARGFYQAISAGVAAQDAAAFVSQAAKLAQAGITDVGTATDLLTTALNSYGKSTSEAVKVSDMLMETVVLGKTNMPQLAKSFSRASAAAANMGVEMSELLGITAMLTKQGVPTAEAMTQVKAALTALVNPSKELQFLYEEMGVSSGRALIEQEGLAGALDKVRTATQGNDSMLVKALRSTEALNGAYGITGDKLKETQKLTEQVADSNGRVAEASKIAANEIGPASERISASFTIMAESIDKATNASQFLIDAMNGISDTISDPAFSEAYWTALAEGPERFFKWFLTGKGYIEQTNDEIAKIGLTLEQQRRYEENIETQRRRNQAAQMTALETAQRYVKLQRALEIAEDGRFTKSIASLKQELTYLDESIGKLDRKERILINYQTQIERVNVQLKRNLITQEQWKTKVDQIKRAYEDVITNGDLLDRAIRNVRDTAISTNKEFENWKTNILEAASNSSLLLKRIINAKEIRQSQSRIDEIMLGYEDDKLAALEKQKKEYEDHLKLGGQLTEKHQGILNLINNAIDSMREFNSEARKSATDKTYDSLKENLRTPLEVATAELNKAQEAIGAKANISMDERADMLARATNRFLEATKDPESAKKAGGGVDKATQEAERRQQEFEQLEMSLMTEEEAIMRSYNERMQIVINATEMTEQRKAEIKQRITADTNRKLDDMEQRRLQTSLRVASDFFGGMSQLAASFGKKGAKIAKAAAIAQATIDMYASAVAAYKSVVGVPYVGPVLAPIAAAGAIAAGVAQIQAIRSQPVGGYAQGGIIPGTSTSGDRLTANVNSGEMVLNKQQQTNLFRMASQKKNSDSSGRGGNVTIINQTRGEVSGEQSTDSEGNMQILIREAVQQTKNELTNEASLGGGSFLPAMEGAYGIARK